MQYANWLIGKKILKSSTAGALLEGWNLTQALFKKYYEESLEIEDANNFSYDDPEKFSSLFQGSKQQEIKKRNSFKIKQQGKESVIRFIGKINFEKPLNKNLCCERFRNEETNCLYVDLNLILSEEKSFFLQHNENDKVVMLNQVMDELSFLFLAYFIGLYKSSKLEEEFAIQFVEIQEFIYKQIRKRAKTVQKQFYSNLVEKVTKYRQDQKQDLDLAQLCNQIANRQIDLSDVKMKIEQFYTQKKFQLQSFLEKNFLFHINDCILDKNVKKIRQQYYKNIIESFQIYRTLDIKLDAFLCEKQIVKGIAVKEINKSLQYLILSIDWKENCELADLAVQLLFSIQKYDQSENQILAQQQIYSIELLFNFHKVNNESCINSQQWWKTNINEQQNILVIFQLYTILSKLQFINKQLLFGDYQPMQRQLMILILRMLNNGKYHYLNYSVLEMCEAITWRIKQLIQIDIDCKQQKVKENQILIALVSMPTQIIFQHQKVEFKLHSDQKQYNKTLLLFQQKYALYNKIISPIQQNEIIQQGVIYNHKNELSQILTQIQQEDNSLKDKQIPNFCLQEISPEQERSNNVTLVISGFISEGKDSFNQWKNILKQGSGTVIALKWESKAYKDLVAKFLKVIWTLGKTGASTYLAGPTMLVPGAIELVGHVVDNPYEEAYQAAVLLGKYLGYLIGKHNLFGDRQLNIVVHSLGSIVLFECIKILDKLYEKEMKQQINQILIMGGVADTNKLRKRRYNSVSGKIFNIYSQNDNVLPYIY